MNLILSIVTTSFNAEKTIENTFKSIENLKKMTSAVEYIVTDSESTDQTKNIISKYKHIIDNLQVKKDAGIYYGMEAGASLANGKYLLFLNSDDEICPEDCLKIINKLSENDFDFVGCDVLIQNLNQKVIGKRVSHLAPLSFSHKGMPCSHQGFIIKKSLFFDLGQFNKSYKIAADYEMIVRCLKQDLKYANFTFPIAKYTLGGVSYGNKARKENFKIQSLYINAYCAFKNYTYECISSILQRILPIKLILFIKKVKKSNYSYINKF